MNMYGDIDFPSLPMKNVMINNVCVVISMEMQENGKPGSHAKWNLVLTQSETAYLKK